MFKIVLFFVFLYTFPVFSSSHVSSCPDSAFTDLGAKFPAVGRIFSDASGFIGTGTIVQTSYPELKGRVVLTCAHNLEDLEISGAFFHLNGEERRFSCLTPHPKFSEFTRVMCFNAYDIGLCLLDTPLAVDEAAIDLDLRNEDTLDRICTTVGYGRTGHIAGLYCITDNKRRASYSFSCLQQNKQYQEKIRDFYINTNKLTDEDAYIYLNGCLTLSTDNTSDVPLPHGASGGGDSGGPIFSDGKIMATVQNSSTCFRNMPLITASALHEFDKKYETAYTESLNAERHRLQERDPHWEKDSTADPFISDEVDAYSVPITVAQARERKVRYSEDYDSLPDGEISRRLTSHTQENVLLAIHKEWILGVLEEFVGDRSHLDKK